MPLNDDIRQSIPSRDRIDALARNERAQWQTIAMMLNSIPLIVNQWHSGSTQLDADMRTTTSPPPPRPPGGPGYAILNYSVAIKDAQYGLGHVENHSDDPRE